MTTGLQTSSDEMLVRLARAGDDAAFSQLMLRIMPMIRRKAGQYHLPGMDCEDIIQEGLVGLLKAIRLYDPAMSGFSTFASLCVSSHMATAAKAALSQKSRPLRDYAPLDHPTVSFGEPMPGPEDQAILSEQVEELQRKIANLLSGFEQDILRLYLSGLSYVQIAQLQHTTAKAVDNALQRVRRKLRSA